VCVCVCVYVCVYVCVCVRVCTFVFVCSDHPSTRQRSPHMRLEQVRPLPQWRAAKPRLLLDFDRCVAVCAHRNALPPLARARAGGRVHACVMAGMTRISSSPAQSTSRSAFGCVPSRHVHVPHRIASHGTAWHAFLHMMHRPQPIGHTAVMHGMAWHGMVRLAAAQDIRNPAQPVQQLMGHT
jgi:hypothetical protein